MTLGVPSQDLFPVVLPTSQIRCWLTIAYVAALYFLFALCPCMAHRNIGSNLFFVCLTPAGLGSAVRSNKRVLKVLPNIISHLASLGYYRQAWVDRCGTPVPRKARAFGHRTCSLRSSHPEYSFSLPSFFDEVSSLIRIFRTHWVKHVADSLHHEGASSLHATRIFSYSGANLNVIQSASLLPTRGVHEASRPATYVVSSFTDFFSVREPISTMLFLVLVAVSWCASVGHTSFPA